VDPVAVALLVLAIVAGLAVGWGIGQLEFRLTPNILEALVDVQLDPVDWSAPDAVKATMAFLERAPPYLRSVVESIVLVFNSPWISIALGTGPRTFVHKSHADRKAYLDKWVADANLRYGLELLKVVLAIGVYDDPGIWKKIGYCGPVVLPNSPGGPDVFCAYDREDAASRGMVGDARFACRGDP
jgi:hypothetical protein